MMHFRPTFTQGHAAAELVINGRALIPLVFDRYP